MRRPSSKHSGDTSVRTVTPEDMAAAKEAYHASIPQRMLQIQLTCQTLNIGYRLFEQGGRPALRLNHDNPYFNAVITDEVEEWELESIELQLKDAREQLAHARRRLEMAQAAFKRLSADEQAAIREFITRL